MPARTNLPRDPLKEKLTAALMETQRRHSEIVGASQGLATARMPGEDMQGRLISEDASGSPCGIPVHVDLYYTLFSRSGAEKTDRKLCTLDALSFQGA